MPDHTSRDNREETAAAFDRYAHRLTAFVLAATGRSFSSAAGDDVVQETFTQLYRQRVFTEHEVFQLRPVDAHADKRQFAFLCKVAWRVMSKARRGRAPGDVPEGACSAEPEDPERGRPDVSAERTERAELLHATLGEMDSVFREPVALFYFAGLSYEEIAAELGIAPGTVKSRLNRGKAEIRSALESLGVEPSGE